MQASQVALKDFLTQNKTQFVIPVYQRNYDWTENECKQLLNDILAIGINNDENAMHFIGSIVFIHDGAYTSSQVKQLVIIDGQQRLTTMMLVHLALYRFALQHHMEEQAAEINDTILINRFVKEDSSKLKLKQTDANAKAFHYLMTNNDTEHYPEYSKAIDNFNLFFKKITTENFEQIMRGIHRLLFVEVSLERGKDDPQRIFESLNSTGLALSQADLIRNYILMGLEPREQNRIFSEYWEVIENNAKTNLSQESKVSELIRDFLTIINKKIPNKDNVYHEFKEKYKDRDSTFYKETLEIIKHYSLIYNKLLNPEMESDEGIRQELISLKKLEVNVSYPFLIQVYSDFLNQIIDKQVFTYVLRLIQSYVWRRFIVSLPTNSLNKIFMTLYAEIDKSIYIPSLEKALIKKRNSQRFPTDLEIDIHLLDKDMFNIQSKNKSYYFEKMEHFNNREKVNLDSELITIEHIFPQHPDKHWQPTLSTEDYQSFLNKNLHTIANLTLSGNNGALGNKIFTEKKNMNKDDKRQGYLYSNLWLNEYLKTIDCWGLKEYENRFSLLVNRFKKIWAYPNASIIDVDEEYTLFDSPDPTHKTLEYFNFCDEVIISNEFSKMYVHIISKLFEINPSKLLQFKDILSLNQNKEKLRSPSSINENYYIETNLDNISKFNRLKRILQAFEMEDELTFKYEN